MVASVSAGAAPLRTTSSVLATAVGSVTSANATDVVPPGARETARGSASGVGPSMSVTVAVAPVSPLTSSTSATTSIGRDVVVCAGANTPVTTRSGRTRVLVNARTTFVRQVWMRTTASTSRSRGTGPSSMFATPFSAAMSFRLLTSAREPSAA